MPDIYKDKNYNIKRFVLGPLGTNCYVIVNKSDGDAVIIDPGYSNRHFVKTLENENITPKMVLLTHGHFDHIKGLEHFADLPIFIHSLDKEMLTDNQKNSATAFLTSVNYTPKKINTFEDNDEIKFKDKVFKVIYTPGHSKGSSMFLFLNNILFTGDAIFKGSIGRYDGFGASEEESRKTIEKVSALKGNYLLYPGHGDSTTLNTEKLNNPYFNGW